MEYLIKLQKLMRKVQQLKANEAKVHTLVFFNLDLENTSLQN